MTFDELPTSVAWRHGDGRDGFESVFLTSHDSGYRLDGHTAAVEDGADGLCTTQSHSTAHGSPKQPESKGGPPPGITR